MLNPLEIVQRYNDLKDGKVRPSFPCPYKTIVHKSRRKVIRGVYLKSHPLAGYTEYKEFRDTYLNTLPLEHHEIDLIFNENEFVKIQNPLNETYERYLKLKNNPQLQQLQEQLISPDFEDYGDIDYVEFYNLRDAFLAQKAIDKYSDSYLKSAKPILSGYNKLLKKNGIESIKKAERPFWRVYCGWLWEQELSRSTILSHQLLIKSFYSFLFCEGLIVTNPFSNSEVVKPDKRLPQFLTQEEMKLLLDAPDTNTTLGLRDRAVIEFLYATGVRVSELTGLNLENLHLVEKEALVLGKFHKERLVMWGTPTASILDRYLTETRPLLLGDKKPTVLFLNSKGEPISKKSIECIVSKYGKKILGKRVWPHLIRHTMATHLLAGGAPIEVIQELLGHADISTTQIYASVSQPHIKKQYLKAHPFSSDSLQCEDKPEELWQDHVVKQAKLDKSKNTHLINLTAEASQLLSDLTQAHTQVNAPENS